MTQLNEEHFELHDANKDKLYQEKKRMKNIKDFFANQSKVMLHGMRMERKTFVAHTDGV